MGWDEMELKAFLVEIQASGPDDWAGCREG